SSTFSQGGNIPDKYSCKGQNVSPPLFFRNVPMKTKSLTLILHDPDAPMVGGFTHWVLFNIPAHTTEIQENKLPQDSVLGNNGGGKSGYTGPCPPSGIHR